MKKLFLLTAAVILGIGTMFANPVDVNTAKTFGQKFVQTNLEQTRGANLELVYTFSVNKSASFYVFNVDDNGFVVVSADDKFRPIVGYCEGDVFDATNPELMYYLNTLAEGRALERNQNGHPRAAEEWENLSQYGRLLSFNRGTVVDVLVQTKWNQNPAPYNSLCPADPLGPGGHVYVGCVATAMAQIMNYWKYPATGQGSNTYYHPKYGTITANFGNTTYDWDNMLNSYSNGYTTEEGNAVATLSFHCGVAVNMNYDNDGSGSNTDRVPGAISQYFRYSTAAQVQYKGNLSAWLNILKTALDKRWPMYYSGSEPNADAGHAFICDGYNDADYFHFNWGWGGSGDNWFLVEDIDYTSGCRTVTNFVPTNVYNSTPQAPTNLTVTKTNDVAQEATVTWVNPLKTLNNSNLTAIDQIVVEREGKVVYTIDNPTPGANMTWVDEHVPCYSTFEYSVYALVDGLKGNVIRASESFGPTCQWKVTCSTTNMGGWKNGYLVAYDGAGREIDAVTTTSSNPITANMDIILGKVSFVWRPGTDNVDLTFKIKDATGTIVYQYSGASNNIPTGILYECNNGCGNAAPTEVPGELFATQDGDNVALTWSGTKTDYGYNIYRDGYLVALAHDTEFVDEDPGLGGHCYQVCYLTDGGESPLTNEACANAGEGCEPGKNLWYELQDNFKPVIYWEAPDNNEGLSGYIVYRKDGDNGEYTKIKQLNASKREYRENKALEEGVWYYYRVVAIYNEIDCTSAPIKNKYGNEFYVKYYYSLDGNDENMAQNVSVYPNPAQNIINVKAENLSSVVIYNSLGQKVLEQTTDGDAVSLNTSNFDAGIYMIRIVADGNEVTKKISVVK